MLKNPQPPMPLPPDQRPSEAHARQIETLFREHNESLLRFLAARLGSHQEAKEIAQEAYVKLLKLDTPSAVSYLRAFLFKTAANLAVDRLRTRSYRERPSTFEFFERLPYSATPEREVGGEQEVRLLKDLLEQLPAKCRYAFVMNKFAERDIDTIAKDMRITPTMVRRYILRALIHCRAGLLAATGAAHDER